MPVAAATKPGLKRGHDILLVVGQSNAQAAGMMSSWPPNYADNSRLADIVQLIEFKPGYLGVYPGHLDPLGELDPNTMWQCTGIGASAARAYAAQQLAPNRKLVVIPAAVGGSSILQWQDRENPDFPQAGPFGYYRRARDLTKWALARLAGENRVVGILVQNGETDRGLIHLRHPLLPDVERWRQLQLDLCSRLRRFAGADVPITIGDMCPDWLPGDPIKLAMQRANQRVARRIGWATTIPTQDLISNFAAGLTVDENQRIHFCGSSMMRLGGRHARAVIDLLSVRDEHPRMMEDHDHAWRGAD